MRFSYSFESAAAVAANTAISNLVSGAAANCKITSVQFGIRRNDGAASSDLNVNLLLDLATARGTQSSTVQAGQPEDPQRGASQITGLDTAWTVAPTFNSGTGASAPRFRLPPINCKSGGLVPFEIPDEIWSKVGTASGWVLANGPVALPAAHLWVVTLLAEE
jgi:hypothetical protein